MLSNRTFINNNNNKNDIDKNDEVSQFDIIRSFHEKEGDLFNIEKKNEAKIEPVNIENSQFGKISPKESISFQKNIKPKKLTIHYDKLDKRFVFKDIDKRSIGSFSVEDLIKYVSQPYDNNDEFLSYLNKDLYNQAKDIVQKFIVESDYNKLKLHDYQSSQFMGDIEMLINLNDELYEFEKKIDKELNYVNINNQKKIKTIIQKFIYLLMNYTLQLLSIISEEMKKQNVKPEISNGILHYSTNIMYRLNTFVQCQLNFISQRTDELKNMMKTNLKLKNLIDAKLDDLVRHPPQSGGGDTPEEEKYSSSSSTEILSAIYYI